MRKRVIKILKDVCVLQPQFPKTSEICVKIMRRISDEEGIKVPPSLPGTNEPQVLLYPLSNW